MILAYQEQRTLGCKQTLHQSSRIPIVASELGKLLFLCGCFHISAGIFYTSFQLSILHSGLSFEFGARLAGG